MSLILWDPFEYRQINPWGRQRRQPQMDLFDLAQRQLERSMAMVDRFFDNDLNLQLRDHVGKLSISEQGDLSYKVDVSGFRPEELKVELDNNEIVVQGEHKEQNEGESVHRSFVRRVLLPEDIQRETIKCDLDSQGRLCVTGKRQMVEAGSRSIPIEIAKSTPITEGGEEANKQTAQ